MSSDTHDEMHTPVLPGRGASDYERYLRTDELLALQKEPHERVHHDELLFETVHQSSELWLKLATEEVEEATAALGRDELAAAIRLLRRSVLCLQYVTTQMEMLNQMSPWEYQQIRVVLGHGSGFDSPGFRRVAHATPHLWKAFDHQLGQAGLTLIELYQRGPRVRGALPARRAPDRVGRADLGVALSPLHDRGPGARRGHGRYAGHPGAGAGQADRPAPDAEAVGDAQPAGRAVRRRAGGRRRLGRGVVLDMPRYARNIEHELHAGAGAARATAARISSPTCRTAWLPRSSTFTSAKNEWIMSS